VYSNKNILLCRIYLWIGLKCAKYRQRFITNLHQDSNMQRSDNDMLIFWPSNMLTPGQTLGGASWGLMSMVQFCSGFNPSRKSLVYQRFISISSYYICCDLPVSITIALRFVSIDTNLFLIDSFSPDIKQVLPLWSSTISGNGLKTDLTHSTQCIHTKMCWLTVPGLHTVFQIEKFVDTK
jgi:hypothetical protein